MFLIKRRYYNFRRNLFQLLEEPISTKVAITLTIMTLYVKILRIVLLSIMTVGIMTLCKITLTIMKL